MEKLKEQVLKRAEAIRKPGEQDTVSAYELYRFERQRLSAEEGQYISNIKALVNSLKT
ncbi:MAG: hypothetical protein ACQEUT_18415 [Bacillota bacterium]